MQTHCLFLIASAILWGTAHARQFFDLISNFAEMFRPSVMLCMLATLTARPSPADTKLPHGSPLFAGAHTLLRPADWKELSRGTSFRALL
jgi:hypothetical protein